MDWSDCPLVEVKPGVQRGRPVLKGSPRIQRFAQRPQERRRDRGGFQERYSRPLRIAAIAPSMHQRNNPQWLLALMALAREARQAPNGGKNLLANPPGR